MVVCLNWNVSAAEREKWLIWATVWLIRFSFVKELVCIDLFMSDRTQQSFPAQGSLPGLVSDKRQEKQLGQLCWIRCAGPAWPNHPYRCPSPACHRPSLWTLPAGGVRKPEDQGCPGKSLERTLSFRELELSWLNNLNQTGTRPILFAGKSSYSLWKKPFLSFPSQVEESFQGQNSALELRYQRTCKEGIQGNFQHESCFSKRMRRAAYQIGFCV